MKIDMNLTPDTFVYKDIPCGAVFTAERKDKEKGIGVYLKVDENNGYFPQNAFRFHSPAVNLETGQMRNFSDSTPVVWIRNAKLTR